MNAYARNPVASAVQATTSADRLMREHEAMVAARSPHESHWRECADHTYPIRGEGLQGSNSAVQSILDRKARLVDSTATDGANILSASMQLGQTPASARWFELAVYGANDADKRWLEAAADQLHEEIHNSNFDSEAPDCMRDMVMAGWFVLFCDVNHEAGGGFVFQSWPLGQCYVSSTRADGMVNVIHRKYKLTARQLQSFAEQRGGSVSEVTAKKAKESPEELVELVHAIYPRQLSLVGGKFARNMPYASCYIECANKHLVLESGFEEFPCIVPRWSRIPNSAYAVGPMFDALPDARQLNELKRMDIAAADVAIGGMWLVIEDGVINPRTLKVGARKVIVAAKKDSMTPLVSGSNWQLADARIAQLQASIRKLLMADQLQPQDGPAMTATEIHARIALIRQQLGPLYGRMQAEYLAVMVTRCFMLGLRAGLFGQPPESLAGANFAVRYISPLARAQRLEDVTAIQATILDVLQIAQLRPEVLDNYDWDEMQRVLATARGVPQKVLVDMDKVVQLREARAQQQAEAQRQAQAQEMQANMLKSMGSGQPETMAA